jgi:aspartyl-tRNA(Asn)/glutamyl-tRNA(Gln) amidotransferase subunit A
MTGLAARAPAATDPADLTLAEVAAAIRQRKLSSVELTQSLLARIARWQPVLNAFVRVEAEEALVAAKAADEMLARGLSGGPLHGVPLAHKDMYYFAGKPAGCGSKVREGWIAPATSTAVARLQAAGAFRLGALHMAEFAYGPTGHNSYLGNACNPWDRRCVTGGSSSGSGAAVAARLVPAALGSDTGGSIRLPAHFCGVTGLKPTNGRVSRANALPLSFTLDTVGPLAQTAQDCALVMAIVAGPDPLDPTTAGAPAWRGQKAAGSAKGLTVGIPSRFYVDDLEPDVAAALDATLKALEGLGARTVQVDLPDQTLVSAAALLVLAVEATSCHAPWLRTRAADYGPQVRARLENGLAYGAVEYLEALRRRGPALAAHLAAVGNADVIVTPASRSAAPTLAETDVGAGAGAEAAIAGITRFMRPVNYLGLPAVVVPAGRSAQGLPIGMQLIGRPFGDETLVALASAFQAATDHHAQVPTL